MCVVYPTGGLGHFEFVKTEGGGLAPEGSAVFAVCDGDGVDERLDPQASESMADGEYYEMKGLVGEVRGCQLIGRGCPHRKGGLNRLWRSIRGG